MKTLRSLTRIANSLKKEKQVTASFPYFKNDTNIKEIYIGVKTFACVGASAPDDHPHIFLNMADQTKKLCPYCSTLYCFDKSLAVNSTNPADCLYKTAQNKIL